MSAMRCFAAALTFFMFGSYALAQQQPAQNPMTFFVTSAGSGNGGNLLGVVGADRHCQTLATRAGAGNRIWRAYLSTQGPNAVDARDRIGNGPWHNAKGVLVAQNVADLHGELVEGARTGPNVTRQVALTEKAEMVNGGGDSPNRHDILTGTQPDGRAFPADADRTCRNWNSSGVGNAQVGHHDGPGGGNMSWNSVHLSKGCSQDQLRATGGDGLFYCFGVK